MESFLIYGRTDTGKTTLLAEIARYLVGLGMKGRLVSADSGWGPFGKLTQPNGGVEALDLTALCTPNILIQEGRDVFGLLNALADGAWMVETPTGLRFQSAPAVDFYMFEGLKSFCDLCMQDHVRKGRQIAENVVGRFEIKVEVGGKPQSYYSGQPGQAHYGHIQRYMLTDWWPRAKGLKTKLFFITTHEAEDTDEKSGRTKLGPATIGSATIETTAQLFQDTLHLVKASKLDRQTNAITSERRAYFVSHPQMLTETSASATLSWPAKISLELRESLLFNKEYPGGYLPITEDKHIQSLLKLRGISDAGASSNSPALSATENVTGTTVATGAGK